MAGQDDDGLPSSREQLNSNIINYMVWRYLQEAGFAMAATWLGREWHKHPDDIMPFARHVKQQQLVHMLQDATFLDDVKSRGLRENHRYFFGDDHGPPHALPTYDISGMRKAEDIPTKKFGLTNGMNGALNEATKPSANVNKVPNGDMMEVDDNKEEAPEQRVEDESPTQPEQEVAPLLHTLSIGESRTVSTDKPIDITETSSKLPWPDTRLISKAAWSPAASDILMIGGANTLRVFGVRNDPAEEIMSKDVPISEQDFEVGEICWTSGTEAVIAMSETMDAGEEEESSVVGKLVQISGWGSTDLHTISAMAGAIFALRYNDESGYLLSLSGGDTTVVTVYHTQGSHFVTYAASYLDQVKLFDAAWMDETRFIACGTNVLQIFDVADSKVSLVQTQEMKNSWFQIAYDPVHEVAVFVDETHTALRQYDVVTEDTKTQIFADTRVTHFQFQPIAHPDSADSSEHRLLATSTENGSVQLWDVTQPFTCIQRLQIMGNRDGYLKQLSFSPDGFLLAAAGFDTAVVWEVRNGEGILKTIWQCTDDAAWQSKPHLNGVDDDDEDAEDEDSEGEEDEGWKWGHDLQWAGGGQKLVFTLKDQAMVMRMP